MEQKLRTICGFCHTSCGMIVHVKDGKMVRVSGDPDHPASRGYLCKKANGAVPLVYHKDRLKTPLLRTPHGFKSITWDEALDFVAGRLLELKDRYGSKTLVRAIGAPYTYEGRDGFHQFLAAYGSTLNTSMGHLCSRPRQLGITAVLGDRIEPDFKNTKMAIFWGGNVVGANRYSVHAATASFSKTIPLIKKAGGKVVLIDPVRSETVPEADMWLPLHFGSDLALALAMMHVIIGEECYDQEFVKEYSTGFEALKEHVKRYTPAWASGVTGLPDTDIVAFAREYAAAKPAVIYDGNGLDMHTQGVETCRAIGMLEALTGNVDRPGANVFMPWSRQNAVPTVKREKEAWEKQAYPIFGELPFSHVIDLMLSEEGPKPRAVIAANTNPALALANSSKVRRALEGLDLLIVFDHFLTATAELAHVVLPDVTGFERNGYRAFSSTDGCFFALRRKVVEPLYDAKPVFEVEYALAKKMGLERTYPFTNNEEWIDFMVAPSEISFRDLQEKQIIFTTPPVVYEKFRTKGFNTPSGKVEFVSERFRKEGYDAFPTYREGKKDVSLAVRFPLTGTSRKPWNYSHTKARNIRQVARYQPRPFVWMHKSDADARGIVSGSWVEIESPIGKIELEAQIDEEAPSSVAIVDFGWGNPWDRSANINLLTDDGERDPLSGGTPNRLFPCEVRRKR
jgi:anaerobic selenocysteine-containing dehydrogenase